MAATTHISQTAQTFTSVYDIATANDFTTKTLAQIGIVSTDAARPGGNIFYAVIAVH